MTLTVEQIDYLELNWRRMQELAKGWESNGGADALLAAARENLRLRAELLNKDKCPSCENLRPSHCKQCEHDWQT